MAFEYIVRDTAGSVRTGTFPEGDPATIYVSFSRDVSLNLGQADVATYTRSGNDLMVMLQDGQVLVLSGYFEESATGPKNLFLSEDGQLVEVFLGEANEGTIDPAYATLDVSDKWSAYDDLVFLDLGRVEPVVAPLAAPVLGGLGGLLAGGAAAGALLLSGGDDVVEPTVNDPDSTQLIGGDEAEAPVVSGTGVPETEVVVTINDKTMTVVVDENGDWIAPFDPADLPDDGIWEASVEAPDSDGDSHVLDGPTIDIDTTPPEVVITDGAESTGDFVNSETHPDGAVISGTSEAGATIDVTINGTTQTTVVSEDGTWTVEFTAEDIATGEYKEAVTVTATDERGNSKTIDDRLVVDTQTSVTIDASVNGDYIINAEEREEGVTYNGTAQPGATVEVSLGDAVTTVTATDAGTWSATFNAEQIPEGTYDTTVSATATDGYGNTASATEDVQVDTELALTIDSGQAGGDDILSGSEANTDLTVTGTVEAGAAVTVVIGDVSRKAEVAEDGTWAAVFEAGTIPAGDYETEIQASAEDAAGNAAEASSPLTVDTEATLTLDVSVGGDDLINAAEREAGVTFGGEADPGATIDVSFGDAAKTVTATDAGTWSATFEAADIAEGTYDATVTATATDSYGNTATASDDVRVDTEISVGIDSGQAGGDDVVNAAEANDALTLTGTAEAGAAVVVTMADVSRETVADADGTWSATFEAGTIPAGEYDAEITALATDPAGNSATTTSTLRVDTEQGVTLDVSVGGDDLINAAEREAGVTFGGEANAGSTVDVSLGDATETVTAAADGTWTATFDAEDIAEGTYDTTVTATATDAYGNTATASDGVSVDTEAEVAIDPGQAGGDDIISGAEADTDITLTGTTEIGSSVTVTVAEITREAVVLPDGSWTATFEAGSIASGEYDTTITAVATDMAGNSATSTAAIRVDTVAGDVTISPLPIEIDDIINAVERSDGVEINGTATPGLTVTVTLGDASTNVVATSDGIWSTVFPASDIPTGTDTLPITASITDAVGNSKTVSDSVGLDTEVENFTHTTPPIEGDGVINAAERADGVTLNGTVEPGSTVTVMMGGATVDATVDSFGNWSANFLPGSIPEGTYEAAIEIHATDAAGNTDMIADTVLVDTEAGLTSQPNQTADDIINAAERESGVTLAGTADPGSSVTVELLGVSRPASVDAAGNWSVTFPTEELPEGTYTASATIIAVDPAGNTASLTESFEVDTQIDTPGVDAVTYSGDDVRRISTEDAIDSYAVNTLETDGSIGTPVATIDSDPTFGTEFTFATPISDGTNLIVTRTDAPGNSASTLMVMEDDATTDGVLAHPGVGSFDIAALDLDYGDDANLVLTEAQIKALSDGTDTLTIHGSVDDTVTVNGAVDTGQTQTIDGQTYNVYTIGDDGATLMIEQDVNVII